MNAAAAQKPAYPQGYFRNPLGIPILLAGNFGECRPGHFHSGLDIKTGGHENEKVYAAADGYISRIKMEPGGFGHGLYITHPNGYTTLYAHLNDFAPAIQRYVRQQQYAQESWTVDLQFGPEKFPVKKGEQIAWSGNTGGSTAPHLHFEIRDTKTEHPLNPQLFGFEVKDDVPPVIKQLVIYDMTYGMYGMQPEMYPLKKPVKTYILQNDSITAGADIIGIGVVADDYMAGSDNTLALYTAEWYVDDELQGRIRLNDIGYDETRYLHAYADYPTKEAGGPWVQCLFRLSGNKLGHVYESLNAAGGLIKTGDENFHPVRIVITDIAGNNSEVSFQLRCAAIPHRSGCYGVVAIPGKASTFKSANARFVLDADALYDQACIVEDIIPSPNQNDLSPRISIRSIGSIVPVHHYFDLRLKPDKLIPFSLRSKVAMIHNNGKEETGRSATPEAEGWYKASVRAFGAYRLVADTTSPLIKPATSVKGSLSKAGNIAFRATDNFTSVKTFHGELDGKWLLFEQHENIWTYIFDAHCPKGKHTLVVKAADENGNEARQTYSFTR